MIMHTPPIEHHCSIETKELRLEEQFGAIFVINLPEAEERRQGIAETLHEIGVNHFEIISAINGRKDVEEDLWHKMDHNWKRINLKTEKGREKFDKQRKGETGCYLSHLKALKIANERFKEAGVELENALNCDDLAAAKEAYKKQKRYRRVMILEDDCAFGIVSADCNSASLENVEELFQKAMLELPERWDMLYFMAWSREPEDPQSAHLVKLTNAISLIAYAVNQPFYETVINHLEKIYDPKVAHVKPVDDAIAELQPQANCFAVNPSIAYQRECVSSITSKHYTKYYQKQPVCPPKEFSFRDVIKQLWPLR